MNKLTTKGIIWLIVFLPISIPTMIVTVIVKISYTFALIAWELFD